MSQSQATAELQRRAEQMTIAAIRRLFKEHRGAATQLALQIGVHKVSISDGLKGHLTSKRIVRAIRGRAAELLALDLEETGKGAVA